MTIEHPWLLNYGGYVQYIAKQPSTLHHSNLTLSSD